MLFTELVCNRLHTMLPFAFSALMLHTCFKADAIENNMPMHMLFIIMHRIYCLIFILQVFLRKTCHYIQCLFLCRFSRCKGNDNVISLSFICFSESNLRIHHLLKGCVRQAVYTAHQNIFLCFLRILNIRKSIPKMCRRVPGMCLIQALYLSDCHTVSTSLISLLTSSKSCLTARISLV